MNEVNLKNIFNEVQNETLRKVNKRINSVKDLICYSEDGLDKFLEILDIILIDKSKEIPSNVNLLVKMTIKSLNDDVNSHFFLQRIYEHLEKLLNCKISRARKKVLNLLNFFSLGDKNLSQISENLFDKDKRVRKECIKLLKNYQNKKINNSTTIAKIFKDLLKHDPNSEVRKEALKSLEITKENFSALITRSADIVPSVRKYFYENIIQYIIFRELTQEQRIFLLKVSFSDRIMVYKRIFIKKIREEYSNDVISIIKHFYDEMILEELKELMTEFFDEIELQFNEEFLKSLDFYSSFLIKEYLNFLDNKFGRDALELPPLVLFLEFFYKKSKECLNDKELIPLVRNLFKILSFFEVNDFESYKIIQTIIYNLVGKNFVEEVIDDIFLLPNISTDINFLGSLVKKNENNEKILSLCRSIFKNISFSELHNAILQEIIIKFNDRKEYYEILFYARLKEEKEEYLVYLFNDIQNTFIFLTDLYLSETFKERISKILIDFLENELPNGNINAVKSICKINLKERSSLFLEKLFVLFYSEKNEEVTQFLWVYFYDYFKENPEILIKNFCKMLEYVPLNKHRIFIDQVFYWLPEENLDSLTYHILIFIHKKIGVNLRTLTNTLNLINITGKNINLLKKIQYLIDLISKRKINLNILQSKITKFIDDIEIEEYLVKEVKNDLEIFY